MNTTALLILEALIKYGPSVARSIANLVAVENPTREQWEAVFAQAEKPYDAYVMPPK
jgi:hypothetical protein